MRRAFRLGVLKLAWRTVTKMLMAYAHETYKRLPEEYHRRKLAAENKRTNNKRGWPQMYTDFLADGRPRITGICGGLIFAAKCGENFLTVLVTFSLKLAAKLSLKKAMARADKAVARIARGLKIQATPRISSIKMK